MTLLDVGANAQARAEHLEQFAFMGAALAQTVLGVERPRVGLLSNGEEAERGSPLVLEAHARLRARADAGADTFKLVGNVEGGDLVSGVADVIVTDGLTGNIALKTMEGVSQTMLRAISGRGDVLGESEARWCAAAGPRWGGCARRSTPKRQGGAYLLGLRRLGVVPHGGLHRRGFAQAILRARRGAREDLIGPHARGAGAGGGVATGRPCPRRPLACPEQ